METRIHTVTQIYKQKKAQSQTKYTVHQMKPTENKYYPAWQYPKTQGVNSQNIPTSKFGIEELNNLEN